MVICLERGADLHMAQLMPLPLTVSCFSKIQIGLPFWYWLTRVVPDKGPSNGCVCVHRRVRSRKYSSRCSVVAVNQLNWCSLRVCSGETMLHLAAGCRNEKAGLFLVSNGAHCSAANDRVSRWSDLCLSQKMTLFFVLFSIVACLIAHCLSAVGVQ